MNFFRKLPRLPRASGTQPGPVTPSSWNAAVDAIHELEDRINGLMPGESPDIGYRRNAAGGFTAWIKKRITGGSSSGPCFFGELITVNDETEYTRGIRGGVVFAGNKVWHVAYQGIDLGTDSEKLIWLRVPVTANADSGKTVSLSGLSTSEVPVWENGDVSTGYPEMTIPPMFPASTDPTGEAILPIGVLTVKDGSARLEPTGCGNFRIYHCPGSLEPTRTGDSSSSSSSV